MAIRIGCAGWSIPSSAKARFPAEGTHLERYAAVFNAVEINSSFYREHLEETYRRWAKSVPSGFRFAVKVPRWITHAKGLSASGADLERFLGQIRGLGRKLGAVLVQLPPRLEYDDKEAAVFFTRLRALYRGIVACEPRHPSWFENRADHLLRRFRIARVAADPAAPAAAAVPGGWKGAVYFRLHGTPRAYYSSYPESKLRELSLGLNALPIRRDVWCVFNNTAAGAATLNALRLMELLHIHPEDR
ncbi:MAG: hypothetical protein KatS3mg081_2473 [Gemmatimonadales bacterium]|nr:MAG: hypothetical protein KatS3mg081_2473 [Gemmatimonadales bacterium]